MYKKNIKPKAKYMVVLMLGISLLISNSASASYLWEVSGVPFVHTSSFAATVTSGQQDGGVQFSNARQLWSEGSYLNWNYSAIISMRGDKALGNYTDSVFHHQKANTSNFVDNSNYRFGWDYTNLPGAYQEQHYSGEEVREVITDPNGLVDTTQYYHQVYWYDVLYNNGQNNNYNTQIIYSNYNVYWSTNSVNTRDDLAKVCYGWQYAYKTTTGNYYGSC